MAAKKGKKRASSEEVLAGLALLRDGLKRWMTMNLPTARGLTVPRVALLKGLFLRAGAAGMSELGAELGMSPRNMTVLVDGLVKEGWVRRVEHAHDRRVKLVELTRSGSKVVEQEILPSLMAAAVLFDDFSATERGEFLRLLEKVAQALRSRGVELPHAESAPKASD